MISTSSVSSYLISISLIIFLRQYIIYPTQVSRIIEQFILGVIVLLFLQMGFSLLNNKFWIRKLIELSSSAPTVQIQLAVHSKNLELFGNCLRKLAHQNYNNIVRIIVIVNGQGGREDDEMEQIFQSVFLLGETIRLNTLYQEMDES